MQIEAKKTPSGKWRAQIYKQGVRRSFTASTKTEAERKANVWKFQGKVEKQQVFREVVSDYIDSRRNVISPSTLTTYRCYQKRYFDRLNNLPIEKISNSVLQSWINDLSETRSAKYIDNIYSFVLSVLRYGGVATIFAVGKKPVRKPKLNLPSEDTINKLLAEARGDPLYVAILLGAFGAMRRGEIFALTEKSITDNGAKITISESVVVDGNRNLVRKETKNYETRTIQPPKFVMQAIAEYGLPQFKTPDTITAEFRKLCKKVGCEGMRFHDLRHFCAAKMLSGGNGLPPIPVSVVQEYGGWKDRGTLIRIYDYVIDEVRTSSMASWDTIANELHSNCTF